jgi:CheY-like chemotaxis protein
VTPRRILVVDDQPDMREMIKISLQLGRDWHVSTAASGREALEMAAVERPDAILLDAMMPEMDGPATFEGLQSHPVTRTIPVVLLTAELEAFDHLDLAGVIQKPFHPLKLGGQLAIMLGWSSE